MSGLPDLTLALGQGLELTDPQLADAVGAVGAITELVEGDVYHWGSLMAAALLGSLPVVILYSFFVEYYVSSLTGAVKE